MVCSLCRQLWSLLLLIVTFIPLSAHADDAETIWLAASQRMLAERVAKAWVLQGLSIKETEPAKQLEAAVTQFDSQLVLLQTLGDAEVQENYSLLNQVWNDFRLYFKGIPRVETGKDFADNNEELVYLTQKGGELLQQKSKVPAAKLVGLAEEIAAISQRMAKLYLLQSWGVKQPYLAKDLAKARRDIKQLVGKLKVAPENTQSTRSQLELVETQWLFFDQAVEALGAKRNDRALITNVATTSERIFQVASDLAKQYQRLAKK
ncbi:type IV pili methyl-accepting chemotaxis transducer N-terminal domain-containing protein [Chitinivorax sp. B]|uniref:type IV pili methyl-accepting chemotaxis transducer N-terminal domain-containing protein n=1 Tax=Chitinivorax sp. B TaxID=2502235 RepID=UPI0010F4F154|nr:type IV pili methyl-accepting chemotaxis transducer N-terminal domain-containing protein [Chitinivorax sp. B]